MDTKLSRMFWGLLLVVLGVYLFAENIGLVEEVPVTGWTIIFGITSLASFTIYFTNKHKNWPMLFPAMVAGAIAAIIWLAENGAEGEWLGSLFMYSVAVPFWVALMTNRKENWWAAIPGWVLTVFASIILFESKIGGELTGALVVFSIALPFYVVYFRSREHWWALIPAGVLSAVSVLILLEETDIGSEIAAGAFLVLLGLVFGAVYFRFRQNWWALIPAGVLASVGIVVGLIGATGLEDATKNILDGILLAGFAITFFILWRLRETHPTEWAKYPAVGLRALSAITLLFGTEQS